MIENILICYATSVPLAVWLSTYWFARWTGKPPTFSYGGDISGPAGLMIGLAWPLIVPLFILFWFLETASRAGYKSHDKQA